MKQVNCQNHGRQEVGVACIHLLIALDNQEHVGFYSYDYKDCARPWAWCQNCEDKLIELGESEKKQWMQEASFKVVCCKCWDDTKEMQRSAKNT